MVNDNNDCISCQCWCRSDDNEVKTSSLLSVRHVAERKLIKFQSDYVRWLNKSITRFLSDERVALRLDRIFPSNNFINFIRLSSTCSVCWLQLKIKHRFNGTLLCKHGDRLLCSIRDIKALIKIY